MADKPKSQTYSKFVNSFRIRAAGLALFFLTTLSLGFLGGWLGARSHAQQNSNTSSSSAQRVITSESQLISELAKRVGPSVVSVNVTSQGQSSYFGYSGDQQSAGTGFILNEGGIILTNRHVVPIGTTSVSVTLSDGTKFDKVSVIGRTGENDSLDIAFLKITDLNGKKLTPAKLGDSSKVQVGDKVIAIGNALGQFQNTVTSGIISGYGRDVEAGDSSGSGVTEQLQDLFQTDAAINQGNSGGPLVNINGEVIGINTAVAGDAQNIGFSIPINDVTSMIKSVLAKGKLERPYLGVRYISITDDYATTKNLPTKRGAFVLDSADSVVAGSPAASAGIKPGDIITKVNGKTIDENNSLSTVLGRLSVDEKVTLTIIRDGKTQDISVTLAAAPQS